MLSFCYMLVNFVIPAAMLIDLLIGVIVMAVFSTFLLNSVDVLDLGRSFRQSHTIGNFSIPVKNTFTL